MKFSDFAVLVSCIFFSVTLISDFNATFCEFYICIHRFLSEILNKHPHERGIHSKIKVNCVIVSRSTKHGANDYRITVDNEINANGGITLTF